MKILIEVNSNIGDLVMNIPILNYLENRFKNVQFDIIADKRSANLLTEVKSIKNIYIKEKNFKAKLILFLKLLKNKYDLALGLRSDTVPLVIRAKQKLYKTGKDQELFDKQSEILYHFSILKKLFDVQNEDIDTHLEFSDQSLEVVKNLIEYQNNEKILFIAPGANSYSKIWPKENFIVLIEKIKHKFDKIIIIGAPSEFDLCKEISDKTNTMNVAGETNLVQVSALLSLGTLFIGNDSGLGHISAAQGVKTLSVFAHANPKRYTPYKQHSIYREDKNIRRITVDEVVKKLDNENLLT